MLALVHACEEAVRRVEVPGARYLHQIDPQPWQALQAAIRALNDRAYETLITDAQERLVDQYGEACARWQQFMLCNDDELMYEFRWEVAGRWCEIRLLDEAFVVFAELAELAADSEMRKRTGRDLLADYARRDELLVDAVTEPLCAQPVSALLNNLLQLSRLWPQLHYCEALERYVDALLLGFVHVLVYADEERVHDVEKFRVAIELDLDSSDSEEEESSPPPPPRHYVASRKFIAYMALVFRDLYRDLAAVARYANCTGDPARFACDSDDEYMRCVEWLCDMSKRHQYEDAPVLMTEHYPGSELLPGEFHMFYVDHPHAYRSLAQVLQTRRANYRTLLDQAYESPDRVVVRELARRPVPRGDQQSTHLRFALAAQLELVVRSHYSAIDWGAYMVYAHEYGERVGELDGTEPNTPILVHLFHGCQLWYNQTMYMFNDVIGAFVAWLRVVRDMMGAQPALGVDMQELCRRILEPPAPPALSVRDSAAARKRQRTRAAAVYSVE